MKRWPGVALALFALAYPFAVYYGSGSVSPRVFAGVLGALWLLRLLMRRHGAGGWPMALAALVFCGALAVFDQPALLHWYPVLINAGLFGLFGWSLLHGMPVIERIARLSEPALPPHAVHYTRCVTKVWALFFLINGLTAAALTLWASRECWLLYNGLIAYMLMGTLFAGEWLVRQRVRRAA